MKQMSKFFMVAVMLSFGLTSCYFDFDDDGRSPNFSNNCEEGFGSTITEELNLTEEKDDLFADDNLEIEQDINLDDLESLMSSDDSENDSGDILSEDELNSMMNFDEDVGLNNIDFDYDDNELVKDDNTKKDDDLSLQEVSENDDIINDIDDFSSFDEIDGLDGLDELDKILEENNIKVNRLNKIRKYYDCLSFYKILNK